MGAKKPSADVRVQNEGGLFLFFGDTDAGQEWLDENIGHATRYAGSFVVEHRYAQDIAAGIIADGLVVV